MFGILGYRIMKEQTETGRIGELDAIVAQYDLNTHPFYTDWRAGTLPLEKLREYSSEYAAFVETIDLGWDRIDMPHYAEEERVHEGLWEDFRKEVNGGAAPRNAETTVLSTAATQMFSDSATAVGALYAFEAQQPKTSATKLDGLKEHYSFSDKGLEYFRVHAHDFAEAEDLRKHVASMSDEEFARTKGACSVLCSAMWSALDGIYYRN